MKIGLLIVLIPKKAKNWTPNFFNMTTSNYKLIIKKYFKNME